MVKSWLLVKHESILERVSGPKLQENLKKVTKKCG